MAVTDRIGDVVLYVGRHAEVKKDAEGKMRGLLNDPLDEKGRKQAGEIASLFEDKALNGIYADDLKRTQQTLEPLAERKGLRIRIDPELRSWDIGSDLEGKSIDANKDLIRRLKSQPELIPVGGESWGEYQQQVRRFFRRYWEQGLESGPILLMLHGSGIQVIWADLGAMESSSAYDATPLENSGIAAIYLGRNGPEVKVLRGAKDSLDE